jgi:hypothetical protein
VVAAAHAERRERQAADGLGLPLKTAEAPALLTSWWMECRGRLPT